MKYHNPAGAWTKTFNLPFNVDEVVFFPFTFPNTIAVNYSFQTLEPNQGHYAHVSYAPEGEQLVQAFSTMNTAIQELKENQAKLIDFSTKAYHWMKTKDIASSVSGVAGAGTLFFGVMAMMPNVSLKIIGYGGVAAINVISSIVSDSLLARKDSIKSVVRSFGISVIKAFTEINEDDLQKIEAFGGKILDYLIQMAHDVQVLIDTTIKPNDDSVWVLYNNFGLKIPEKLARLGYITHYIPTHEGVMVKPKDTDVAYFADSGSLGETIGKYVGGKSGSFIHTKLVNEMEPPEGYKIMLRGTNVKNIEQLKKFVVLLKDRFTWGLLSTNCQTFAHIIFDYATRGLLPEGFPEDPDL
jgi:hypothetical protein